MAFITHRLALHNFLAAQTVACMTISAPQVSILDPACGNGELLFRLASELRQRYPTIAIDAVGFDTDAGAIEQAAARLELVDGLCFDGSPTYS